MITVSNIAAQTLDAGQSITFDSVLLSTKSCAEQFRVGSSGVRIGKGFFDVSFSGNIGNTVAATPSQLAISVNDTALAGSTMISTPTAVGDFNNVAKTIPIENSGSSGPITITVTNTGASTVTVAAGTSLSIRRIG